MRGNARGRARMWRCSICSDAAHTKRPARGAFLWGCGHLGAHEKPMAATETTRGKKFFAPTGGLLAQPCGQDARAPCLARAWEWLLFTIAPIKNNEISPVWRKHGGRHPSRKSFFCAAQHFFRRRRILPPVSHRRPLRGNPTEVCRCGIFRFRSTT